MRKLVALILGGGQGKRLFPLTKERSKPAVPIGGKYRLIDIPITNCLRSHINRIFILTQFNSESLNKHITQTYRFDNFHLGFVNVLAAEQTISNNDWYQGTADAVRKNIKHIFEYHRIKYILILSGDQVYKMDYRRLLDYHIDKKHDITVSVKPVLKEEASAFGIMKTINDKIVDFVEKPKDDDTLNKYKSTDIVKKSFGNECNKEYLASMGIYLFNADTLLEVLDNSFTDFGNEVIPYSIKSKNVGAYFFNDYWEDVGSIKTFLKANLDFTDPVPKFNLYDDLIYTHARYLPPSKVVHCHIDEALLGDGSIIQNAMIKKSIIGIRSIIKDNVNIDNSIILGADYYETEAEKYYNSKNNIIDVGISENTIISNAIVDKNARIGKNCKILNKNKLDFFDGDNYHIRDGIIIIPKNSIITDNTEI